MGSTRVAFVAAIDVILLLLLLLLLGVGESNSDASLSLLHFVHALMVVVAMLYLCEFGGRVVTGFAFILAILLLVLDLIVLAFRIRLARQNCGTEPLGTCLLTQLPPQYVIMDLLFLGVSALYFVTTFPSMSQDSRPAEPKAKSKQKFTTF